ncbi:MAG: PIN domain nuclease [Bacteroidetes bacterium CG_4_10_14_3_um_filter_31_20]|nr:type II toxin-antitoxin system VapC family toxin [Bacteroidota bacterium]NCP79789.1 type II toxin-antitoxin system VapC family toxin [archaeon]PIY02394.1 MAG: PIN domain nuclease [Bacteroidetes bacterium CG_4_10_14_3_um_filter_31_20]
MKILLDSNIVIYLGSEKAEIIENFLLDKKLHISVITKVETLGYHKISEKEKKFLNLIFDKIVVIPLEEEIIATAIKLRQQRKISLGDSFIAATALAYKLTLVTNNTDDFEKIKGLKIINPFK